MSKEQIKRKGKAGQNRLQKQMISGLSQTDTITQRAIRNLNPAIEYKMRMEGRRSQERRGRQIA